MGIFDFFKRKSTVENEPQLSQKSPQMDRNLLVLLALEARLVEMGYQVARHPQYLALIVDGDLELSFMIMDVPGAHPGLMQLMLSASHAKYFPNGIIEYVAGFGQSTDAQIHSALQNYINTTFLTIMDGFADTHSPEFDFTSVIEGHEVLWHPKFGNLTTQGQWEHQLQGEALFELLKKEIPNKLPPNKINWLKIYISKRADGEIIGECNFNNESWDIATRKIYNYASRWHVPGEFKGLKQFIVFRRCDAYDNVGGL